MVRENPLDSSHKATVSAVAHQNNPRGPGVSPTLPKPRKQFASMSTERATGNQSTGPTNEELSDQLTRLKRRCDALEAEKERVEDELQSELEDTREQQREDRHTLARENHELRASHEQLESRVEEVEADRDELRSEVERAEDSRGHIIEDIVDVEERVEEVEEASNRSAEDGDLENTLPIQQTTRIWKVGGTIKTNKTEYAAAIWSDFMDRCKKGRGVRYLDTGKVKGILKEHFRNDDRHEGVGKSVERSTIHRAMDTVIEMAGDLVSKDTIKNGRSALLINDEEFREFCEVIGATKTDSVTDDVTADEAGNVMRAT
jgi:hypothetical protein